MISESGPLEGACDRTSSAVLVTAYNRPDTVGSVIAAIREVRPPRIYLACDGAGSGDPETERAVLATQRAMTDAVGWDCEVRTLFREENLGCARAVSGAIDWFFEHEESGIILEDDCVPDPTFFAFADTLLDRYADDERVMHISGCSQTDFGHQAASYFVSLYPQVWGWATWREAWSNFSLDRDLDRELAGVLERFETDEERKYWRPLIERTFAGQIDTWDYRWAYSIWQAGGVSLYPTRNLVRNIGFGGDATHTRLWSDYRGTSELEIEPIETILHPPDLAVDIASDQEVFTRTYRKPLLPVRVIKVMKRLLLELLDSRRLKRRSRAV